MTTPSPFLTIHQILYLSQLAANCNYDVFASICRASRHRNAQLSLTGVLLFDGQRFCQLLQGPVLDVKAMMADITLDRRHERTVTLFDGPAQADQVQRVWTAGYCDAQELDVFDDEAGGITGITSITGIRGVRGDAAIGAFHAIMARADLAP